MRHGVAVFVTVGLVTLGASRLALQAAQQPAGAGQQAPPASAPAAPAPPTPAQPPTQGAPAAPEPGAQAAPSSPDAAKTIWSGVFTADQAKRGHDLYNKYCLSCHGPDLGGGEMAPALTGGTFMADWDGQTVGDLEERVRLTMPQGDEGTLSHQMSVDILAAVFAANGAPAGQAELPKDVPILKEIQITSKR
jgi:hypothetical protein